MKRQHFRAVEVRLLIDTFENTNTGLAIFLSLFSSSQTAWCRNKPPAGHWKYIFVDDYFLHNNNGETVHFFYYENVSF